MMSRTDLQKIAVTVARDQGLDPALVCSICAHESAGWQQYAVRYEPGFYNTYISSMKGLTPTEMTLRATSFGLMQIMGQTARELGFDAPFLSQLLDPSFSCLYGCKKLKHELDKNGGDVNAALLGYNGGGNANYPQLVMAHYHDYAYLNSATMA